MLRDYVVDSGVWEFNSGDKINHPWGDFVMNLGNPVEIVCDGRSFVVNSDSPWLFVHRDSDGVIDHFFDVYVSPKRPDYDTRADCPICNPRA